MSCEIQITINSTGDVKVSVEIRIIRFKMNGEICWKKKKSSAIYLPNLFNNSVMLPITEILISFVLSSSRHYTQWRFLSVHKLSVFTYPHCSY